MADLDIQSLPRFQPTHGNWAAPPTHIAHAEPRQKRRPGVEAGLVLKGDAVPGEDLHPQPLLTHEGQRDVDAWTCNIKPRVHTQTLKQSGKEMEEQSCGTGW